MKELILSIALTLNVFFLGCVTAWLSKIYDEIGCVHSAEIRAHAQGWADCLKCMDALKERKADADS